MSTSNVSSPYSTHIKNDEFCMPCFRTALKAFNVASTNVYADEGLTIDCRFHNAASVKCHQCAARRCDCDQPWAGMVGDARFLQATIAYINNQALVPDEDSGDFGCGDGAARFAIATALKQLCVAFEAAEKAARRGVVTGVPKSDKPKALVSATNARVSHLVTMFGKLPRRGSPNHARRVRELRPRLLEGDHEFPAWAGAVRRWFATVADAAREGFDTDAGDDEEDSEFVVFARGIPDHLEIPFPWEEAEEDDDDDEDEE